MPFVFSKNSLPILTPNLAFVRPVAKALLASSNRDVDLMGSEWNSICTGGAKELKLTPVGNQNNLNNHSVISP